MGTASCVYSSWVMGYSSSAAQIRLWTRFWFTFKQSDFRVKLWLSLQRALTTQHLHLWSNAEQQSLQSDIPPHVGQSDHFSLLLIPAYTPLRKQTPPSTRVIKSWPDDDLRSRTWRPSLGLFFSMKCCLENVTATKSSGFILTENCGWQVLPDW